MRNALLGAFCAAITLGLASNANALGDVCYGPLQASGNKKHSEHDARNSAIWHWQKAAAKRNGARASDWWYSGDRTIFCNWDSAGRHFWCSAVARPCARK